MINAQEWIENIERHAKENQSSNEQMMLIMIAALAAAIDMLDRNKQEAC